MMNKKEFSNCLLLGLIIIVSSQSLYAQNNEYPSSGDVTIKNYSPLLILQRNTSIGGFIQGIQTRQVDGSNNWFFGSHGTDEWRVSKGDYSNAKLTILSNNNVGIGTTDPQARLDVNGTIYASSIGGFANATYAVNQRNPIWRFGNADGFGISYFQGSAGVNGGDSIGFHFGSPTANNSILQVNSYGITTQGNVGIGTTSPENSEGWERVLEVKGNNHAKIISSSSTVQTGVFSHDSGYYGAPVGGIVGTTTNNPFSIMTNKSTKLTVATNGNIGIGTTNPENAEGWAKVLEVKGNTDSKIISSSSSVQTGIFSHNFGFYGAPVGGIVGTTTNNPFSIMTNKSTKLTVAINGNVGIGTTNPDEKLTVNGNIHAKEVRVDLNIPPDYVFDHYYSGVSKLKPSYKMPSLLEVEEFVKQNHHLPEIPSAQEIVENGLRLAQMNGLLLQKVEELTLYAIEQEKKQKSLEQELAELKTQVKAILKQK